MKLNLVLYNTKTKDPILDKNFNSKTELNSYVKKNYQFELNKLKMGKDFISASFNVSDNLGGFIKNLDKTKKTR